MDKIVKRIKGHKIQVYNDLDERFEETYNKVRLSEKTFNRWKLENKIYTKDTNEYDLLEKHVYTVLRHAERIEVPNKKVKTDRPGTSMLLLKDSSIEIAHRYKRKDGSYSDTTNTPKKCFISNAIREKFFKVVKEHGHIQEGLYSDRYYLSSSDYPYFDLWKESMMREYQRLSGIDPAQIRKSTKHTERSIDKIANLATNIYDNKLFASLNEFFSSFIDENYKALYTEDGKFLQYLEDPIEWLTIYNLLFYLSDEEFQKLASILNIKN